VERLDANQQAGDTARCQPSNGRNLGIRLVHIGQLHRVQPARLACTLEISRRHSGQVRKVLFQGPGSACFGFAQKDRGCHSSRFGWFIKDKYLHRFMHLGAEKSAWACPRVCGFQNPA